MLSRLLLKTQTKVFYFKRMHNDDKYILFAHVIRNFKQNHIIVVYKKVVYEALLHWATKPVPIKLKSIDEKIAFFSIKCIASHV